MRSTRGGAGGQQDATGRARALPAQTRTNCLANAVNNSARLAAAKVSGPPMIIKQRRTALHRLRDTWTGVRAGRPAGRTDRPTDRRTSACEMSVCELWNTFSSDRWGYGRFADTYNCIKTAFHGTDILADILARSLNRVPALIG